MKFEDLESRVVLSADPLTAPYLPGDVDVNGKVDFNDFLQVSRNFGQEGQFSWGDGDLDGDGRVLFSDFLIVSQQYGKALTGDINGDAMLTLEDAYELRDAVLAGEAYDPAKDFNGDGQVNAGDIDAIGRSLLGHYKTHLPDINLDCVVDADDASVIYANFGQQVIGGWIDGDLDNDGEVGFGDLLALDPSPF